MAPKKAPHSNRPSSKKPATSSSHVVPVALVVVVAAVAVYYGRDTLMSTTSAGTDIRVKLTPLSLPNVAKVKKVKKCEQKRKSLVEQYKKVAPSETTPNEFEYNVWISDRLPQDRRNFDTRNLECLSSKYLPNSKMEHAASIIMVLTREAESATVRTLKSLHHRTPSELVHEILVVDTGVLDVGVLESLKRKIKASFEKVRLIELTRETTSLQAKMAAVTFATGKVLIFINSYTEFNDGWLEPLLHHVTLNPTSLAMPLVDVIDGQTWEWRTAKLEGMTFDWNLRSRWQPLSASEETSISHVSPFETPAMNHETFAIDRKHFVELGGYDNEITSVEAERVETALRVWTCGGSLVIIPCSHVGVVHKGVVETTIPFSKNRVAEVWLDDFKLAYYETSQNNLAGFGDVSARRELRKNLGCKSFRWYIENVFPSIDKPIVQGLSWDSEPNANVNTNTDINTDINTNVNTNVNTNTNVNANTNTNTNTDTDADPFVEDDILDPFADTNDYNDSYRSGDDDSDSNGGDGGDGKGRAQAQRKISAPIDPFADDDNDNDHNDDSDGVVDGVVDSGVVDGGDGVVDGGDGGRKNDAGKRVHNVDDPFADSDDVDDDVVVDDVDVDPFAESDDDDTDDDDVVDGGGDDDDPFADDQNNDDTNGDDVGSGTCKPKLLQNTVYHPIDNIAGEARTAQTFADCVLRCHHTPGCAFASHWQDGDGCHLSNVTSKPVVAIGVDAAIVICNHKEYDVFADDENGGGGVGGGGDGVEGVGGGENDGWVSENDNNDDDPFA